MLRTKDDLLLHRSAGKFRSLLPVCSATIIGLGNCSFAQVTSNPEIMKEVQIQMLSTLTSYKYTFFVSLEGVNKKRKIILVALCFLIWGETVNVSLISQCVGALSFTI